MLSTVLVNPPLGQRTFIDATEHVKFNVYIEHYRPVYEWQVQIWHDALGADQWSALPLSLSPKSPWPRSRYTTQAVFTGDLSSLQRGLATLQYTVRFRAHETGEWKWAHDKPPHGDGLLVFHHDVTPSTSIEEYLAPPKLVGYKIQKVASQVPFTHLWQFNAPAAGSEGDILATTHTSIGRVRRGLRSFKLSRVSAPWIAPIHGFVKDSTRFQDIILESVLTEDGVHFVLLAVSGTAGVNTQLYVEKSEHWLLARNDGPDAEAVVLASAGFSFNVALAAVVYRARELMSPAVWSSDVDEDLSPEAKALESKSGAKSMENSFTRHHPKPEPQSTSWTEQWEDGLTFCTWNSLGTELSEKKILDALTEYSRAEIPIANVIVDDGWQYVDDQSRLLDFRADPKKFPKGLEGLVESIKLKNPKIKHVAVWHALLGSWAGISPNHFLPTRCTLIESNVVRGSINMPPKISLANSNSVSTFYDDFYSFLARRGITATKSDAQFALDALSTPNVRLSCTLEYLNALRTASQRHFSGRTISCMSLFPRAIFMSQLPSTGGQPVPLRNSDDFNPADQNTDAQTWHVYSNAHNAVFTNYLNVTPDWDMFKSGSKKWAQWHAMARALSGGMITLSDKVGKHNAAIVRCLFARTPRETFVTLRPNVPGRALEVYNDFREDKLLKIGAFHGDYFEGCGMTGLFNCGETCVRELVKVGDAFLGMEDLAGVEDLERDVVVREHGNPLASRLMRKGDVMCIDVEGRSCKLFTTTPLHTHHLHTSSSSQSPRSPQIYISNLGLTAPHYTGATAIARTTTSLDQRGTHIQTLSVDHPSAQSMMHRHRISMTSSLRFLGNLGMYLGSSEDYPLALDLERDVIVFLEEEVVPLECVRICSDEVFRFPERRGDEDEVEEKTKEAPVWVVSVDMDRAWNELRFEWRASGEVEVTVIVAVEKGGEVAAESSS